MRHETCGRVQELLPAYLEGLLGHEDGQMVRNHLRECVGCRREADRWARLDQLLLQYLGAAEAVSEEEVQQTLVLLRRQRPLWRLAPAGVRLWRRTAPIAGLAAVVGLVVIILSLVPSASVSIMRTLVQEAKTWAVAPAKVPDFLTEMALDMYANAPTWPGQLVNHAQRSWRQGVSAAEACERAVGVTPLALCLVLLTGANLIVARTARAFRSPFKGG